jgi:hypothetical protein
MGHTEVLGRLLLKGLNVGAQNELRSRQGFQKCRFQLGLEIAVLGDQIDHRDGHGGPFKYSENQEIRRVASVMR